MTAEDRDADPVREVDSLRRRPYTSRPGRPVRDPDYVPGRCFGTRIGRLPVSEAEHLGGNLRSVFIVQLILTVVVAAGAVAIRGGDAALAALFGGGIALVNTALLGWHARRAERGRALNAQQSLQALIRCALERYVAVALLFALGLGTFKLAPGPLLIGFMAALAGLLGLGRTTKG